jgi:formylglycine-generating enzyme required for sulfatase activity
MPIPTYGKGTAFIQALIREVRGVKEIMPNQEPESRYSRYSREELEKLLERGLSSHEEKLILDELSNRFTQDLLEKVDLKKAQEKSVSPSKLPAAKAKAKAQEKPVTPSNSEMVASLKVDALKAEIAGDRNAAKQLWQQVLAAAPTDPDRAGAIRRLNQPLGSDRADNSGIPAAPAPSGKITRRRWLSFAGSVLASAIIALLAHNWWRNRKLPIPATGLTLKEYEFETVTVNRRGEIIRRTPGKAESEYFTEDLGDGATLDMVYIPGGTFIMGSPEDEEKRDSDEGPQHEVTVPAFYMGKFEVTQAQWRAVAALPKVERDLDPDPSYFKGDNRPVESVSWYDAVEFCQRLSQKTGREYRLPSESEWEYACRAGTTTPFYFGETITTDLVNYDGNYTYADAPKGQYREQTTPVGQFPPNAFGLYDMHGNVWEWCADTWHDNYVGAPTDGSAWTIGGNDNRSLRGGSWDDGAICRSACRSSDDPVWDGFNYGFRVVRG